MTATAPHDRSVVDVILQGPRLFAAPADEPRARRASDVITLVSAAVALTLISFAAVPTPGFTRTIAALLDAAPRFLDTAWQFFTDLLVLVAIVFVLATLVRRRWSIGRDVLVAGAAATVVGLVQAGIPEEIAFAVALMSRLASFYLPPIWGFVAMRWLERNDHM
jgi:hypothetical protein